MGCKRITVSDIAYIEVIYYSKVLNYSPASIFPISICAGGISAGCFSITAKGVKKNKEAFLNLCFSGRISDNIIHQTKRMSQDAVNIINPKRYSWQFVESAHGWHGWTRIFLMSYGNHVKHGTDPVSGACFTLRGIALTLPPCRPPMALTYARFYHL